MVNRLSQDAIPACRKAGIQIVWLNWSLTQQDIDEMPPTIVKAPKDLRPTKTSLVTEESKAWGSDIEYVQLEDGSVVEGGRVLMLDQWNSASYEPPEKKH